MSGPSPEEAAGYDRGTDDIDLLPPQSLRERVIPHERSECRDLLSDSLDQLRSAAVVDPDTHSLRSLLRDDLSLPHRRGSIRLFPFIPTHPDDLT